MKHRLWERGLLMQRGDVRGYIMITRLATKQKENLISL